MKKAALIIFILSFILSGAIAQNDKDAVYDDVYYSASKKKKKDKEKVSEPDTSESALPKSSTLQDDYNDYSYSTRIKRFHNPEQDAGYYDEVYTDPSNYDTNYVAEGSSYYTDASPNVSLSFGVGFGSCWGPSLSFGYGWGYDPWYWNYGWGYPYNGYYSPYYSYWDYPYYGWGYGGSYWSGYRNGYWDGNYWGGEGFNRTGWAGVAGNEKLDTDKIRIRRKVAVA